MSVLCEAGHTCISRGSIVIMPASFCPDHGMSMRLFKTAVNTLISVGPLMLVQWLPANWLPGSVVAYLLVVGVVNYAFVLKPEAKLPKIRKVELTALFEELFESQARAEGERFPIRVHI